MCADKAPHTQGVAVLQCPEQWTQVPLGSVCDIRFSSVDKLSARSEEPVRLCNYIDVYNNGYITADMPFMHATATLSEINQFGVLEGDVLITKDSETPDDIGVPAVIDSTAPDLVCGYHLAMLRPDADRVDSTFLAKQLTHPRIRRYFGQQANGTTRYGLSAASIANTPLWLPELPLQQRIAKHVRFLDSMIAQTRGHLTKLLAIKSGLEYDLLAGLDATSPNKESPS